MYFLIIGTDAPAVAQRRAELRAEHVDYWLGLGKKVQLGGPLLSSAEDNAEPRASLLIVKSDTADQAIEIAKNDPFSLEGVFSEISVEPMRLTLGSLFT